uniref:ATP synthase complex subunit 8 n=1 Tax=Euploea mulciber TaxID=76235 RepID=G9BCU4_9NEOP|nr:ATP synthase F0 subunit 8 [Euploea mulciber]ADP01752.1 ATP synthase F0 subunit 8 [Euploea mulciber]WCI21408.1 ATP synthase F0 subunit 8 [Euploea mulciber]
MPQMMPINWLMSILFFITLFIMFNIMNYFTFYIKYNNSNKISIFKNKSFNWKW